MKTRKLHSTLLPILYLFISYQRKFQSLKLLDFLQKVRLVYDKYKKRYAKSSKPPISSKKILVSFLKIKNWNKSRIYVDMVPENEEIFVILQGNILANDRYYNLLFYAVIYCSFRKNSLTGKWFRKLCRTATENFYFTRILFVRDFACNVP